MPVGEVLAQEEMTQALSLASMPEASGDQFDKGDMDVVEVKLDESVEVLDEEDQSTDAPSISAAASSADTEPPSPATSPVHADSTCLLPGEDMDEERHSERMLLVDDEEAQVTAEPAQADVTEGAPQPEAVEWVVDIPPNAQATQADTRLRQLCQEVSALSKKAFGEDVCATVSGRSKWRLTVLTGDVPEGYSPVIGFVVYKLKTEPKFRCLSIAKIAVHPDYRKHGFGSTILAWCVARAKTQKEITSIKLCALPEVVSWYRKRGFVKEMKLEDDEDSVPGQVAMSKYLPTRGKTAGKMRRR